MHLSQPATLAAEAPPRIMLAVHQGFSVRYLLQTDIFRTLRQAGAEIVVVGQDEVGLADRFAGPGVIVDVVPAAEGRRAEAKGRLQRVLAFLRKYAHAGHVQTTEDHYRIAVKEAEQAGIGRTTRLQYRLLRLAILAARRWKGLRRAVLALESRLYVPAAYVELMRRYRPDMVVTTSLGTFKYDHYVMRAARRLGIPVTTVVLSWDNTTSLGYPGAEADRVIAWTEAMRRELVEWNDVPPERVEVGGVAHWDSYYRPDPAFDRAAFLRGLGCDPARRTILVATKAPSAYAYNPNLALILAEAIEKGDLPADCQVLVRVHPLHYRFENGKAVYGELLDVYRRLAAEHPSIILNEPEIRSERLDYDMAEEELLFLTRLLKSTDVLVNIFSTMNIEGAIFDVPLVNVSFEGDRLLYPARLSPRCDILIDWRATHNQRVVALKGFPTVWSPAEMVAAVRDYLADPSRDAEGRRRIVAQETGPRRGDAGRFIGQRLLDHALEFSGKRRPVVWPARIALVVFDFDGVMTDNTVIVTQAGEEAVRCHRGDGWGIKRLREAGLPMLILSTEANPVVAAHAAKLKLECRHGQADKAVALSALLAERGIDPAEVVYLGNDENDLGCLELVGMPVVVADAHPSVREAARLVLKSKGGEGAVRELCDLVLARSTP